MLINMIVNKLLLTGLEVLASYELSNKAEVGQLGWIWRMFQQASAASFSTVIDTCAQISLCCENSYYKQILSLEARLCCIKRNEKFRDSMRFLR